MKQSVGSDTLMGVDFVERVQRALGMGWRRAWSNTQTDAQRQKVPYVPRYIREMVISVNIPYYFCYPLGVLGPP